MSVSRISLAGKLRKITRRGWVRIISYCIAVGIALGGATIYGYTLAVKYRTQLEYTYQRALNDLSGYLNNIDITLQKGLYSGSATQLSNLSAKLWRESGSAKTALSQLPTSGGDLSAINRFLSQVGDYSLSLSKKAIGGAVISEEERNNLIALSNTAAALSGSVDNMRAELEQGRLWLGEVRAAIESGAAPENLTQMSAAMQDAEDSITDYPTLIYDGPFSDNVLERDPRMTKDKPEVTREDARAVAAAAIGATPEQVADDSDEDGKMPSYGFSSGETVLSVTKAGGYLVYFRNARGVGEETLTQDQAMEKARAYLAGWAPATFKESYYMTDEGVCVINFAYLQGDVICYTDLVKVGVALDNGEIVMVEARGYLMNHAERDIPAPKYTVEKAKAALNSSLTVKSSALTLIPSDGLNELPCYEFTCDGMNGQEVLVYINTQTLAEEQILILLKTDGGALTK